MKIEDLVAETRRGNRLHLKVKKYLEEHPRDVFPSAVLAKDIGVSLSHLQANAMERDLADYRRMVMTDNRRVWWGCPKAWEDFDKKSKTVKP